MPIHIILSTRSNRYSRSSTDTLTLIGSPTGQNVSFPNIIFGCGHNDDGQSGGKDGIVGLGGSPLSLVSQLGAYIDYKFSYCMSDGLPTKCIFVIMK